MSVAKKRKRQQDATERRRRLGNIASAAFTLVMTLIPLGFSMRVFWACTLWFFAWLGVLVFLFTVSNRTLNSSAPLKIVVSVGLTAILAAVLFHPVRGMWCREKAVALSGALVSPGTPQPPNVPQLQLGFGTNGTVLSWGGPKDQAMLQVFYDAGIKIEFGENGETLLSTPIRDRDGQIIAEIIKNRWTVSPSPVVWDKNYNDGTLEVKDRRGHVVLQARVLGDRVQIAGEWRNEFGAGFAIRQSPDGDGLLSIWRDPHGEQETEAEIQPIFKYPSVEHWGELISAQ